MKKYITLLSILLLTGTSSYSFQPWAIDNIPPFDYVFAPDGVDEHTIVSYPGGSTSIIVEMIAPHEVIFPSVKGIAHILGASVNIPIPDAGHLSSFPHKIGERIILEITLNFNPNMPPISFELDLIVYDQTNSPLGGGKFTIDLLDLTDF